MMCLRLVKEETTQQKKLSQEKKKEQESFKTMNSLKQYNPAEGYITPSEQTSYTTNSTKSNIFSRMSNQDKIVDLIIILFFS